MCLRNNFAYLYVNTSSSYELLIRLITKPELLLLKKCNKSLNVQNISHEKKLAITEKFRG